MEISTTRTNWARKVRELILDSDSGDQGVKIIYIMLLSDLEKLLSVWENMLSIANVT